MNPLVKTVFDRLEKYAKTDISYLAKGGFWTSLGYGFQIFLGILNTVILANFLAKDLLGTYQFILAMAGVVSIFTLTGMGTAVARAVAQGHEQAFRHGLKVKLKWSTGVFVAALVIAGYYWIHNDVNLALAFLFVALTVPLTESFVLYESYLQGKQAFKDGVTLGMWRKPLPVLVLLTTLYFTNSIPALIGAYLGATLLSTLLIYRSVRKKYQPPVGTHPETIQYSKQISLMGVIAKIAEHADKVLLWYLLGPVAVASFTIAQLATKYSGGLTGVIAHIALPKVSQRDLPALQKTLPRKVRLFTLTLIPAVLIYIALIPLIFNIVFPNYSESILLAQVLGISIFFLPRSLYNQALIGHQKTRALYLISVIAPTVKIASTVVLILLLGIWGAVFGLIIGELVAAILSWHFFNKAT